MTETTYLVGGMTCEHCVRSVTEELSTVDGVRLVSVDLDSGAVTVTSDDEPDQAQVTAAVHEAGYTLLPEVR